MLLNKSLLKSNKNYQLNNIFTLNENIANHLNFVHAQN